MQLRNPKVYTTPFEKEKKTPPKILILSFLSLIVLGGLFYFLFYSSFFKLKNIIIENPQPEINEVVQELKGKNIFLFNTREIKGKISQKLPDAENIQVARGLPDTLRIQFQKKGPRIIWQTQGKDYLVVSSGEIYREAREEIDLPLVKDNNNIAITLGQKVASENFLDFTTELNALFNQATSFQITRFEVNETLFQLDAKTDQGWKVIFDTTRKASEQLADLMTFLKSHKSEATQYIDLRVKGRVYFQ